MSWMTDNSLLDNTALTNSIADISKVFINRDPRYMVIEVTTTGALTGDVSLWDSADGSTYTQVATAAYDAATSLIWRIDARTTPIRNNCKVRMVLDAGTGTVGALRITYSP